jgi:hypothetical protein
VWVPIVQVLSVASTLGFVDYLCVV